MWVKESSESTSPQLVTTWAVYFTGLFYLGSQPAKETCLFNDNTVIFGMTWGFFTANTSLKSPLVSVPPQQTQENASKSYSVSSMCRLVIKSEMSNRISMSIHLCYRIHRMQRAIYKETAEADRLKQEIQSVQSNPNRYRSKSVRSIPVLSASPADLLALQELKAKRQILLAKVAMLQQERSKQLKSLDQLKETLKNLRVDNHTRGWNM